MKKRYNSIDFLRGFTIINMIIYHLIFDLENIYGFNFPYNFFYYQQYICMSFIFISGLSLNFSRLDFKKIFILGLSSLAITLGSYFFMRTYAIYFGIIHFFFFANIIFYIFKNPLKKLNPYFAFFLFLALFLFFRTIYGGSLAFGLINLPAHLYEYNLFFLGLPSKTFTSGDYFPLIPWMFLFLSGFYFFPFVKVQKKEASHNIINIMGRHSLLIYLLHQGVLFLILKNLLG